MMLSHITTEPPMAVVARYTQDAPVDVEGIARELGLTIIREPMTEDVAGKIVRDTLGRSPGGYTIYVNSDDVPRRQRFTLAHELGHYVLHRDLIGDGLIDSALYRSKLGDWYERQANRWAADTLMPGGLVRGLYRGGMVSLTALSSTLDVSEPAVRIRLSELRLAP